MAIAKATPSVERASDDPHRGARQREDERVQPKRSCFEVEKLHSG
jgi:hypothetical protein